MSPLLTSLIALTACGPGTLSTNAGDQPLRTALFLERPDQDRDELLIVLLNSTLPCDVTVDTSDPEEAQQAWLDLGAALFRENARVVYLRAYRLYTRDSWLGHYPLYNEPVDTHLEGTNPYAVQAFYVGVNEAKVDESEGLYRTYQPTDVDIGWVNGPGELRVSGEGDTLRGEFNFPGIDLSGRFRAKPCSDEASIFGYAELLDSFAEFYPSPE